MEPWFWLSVAAAVLWAAGNIIDKYVFSRIVKSYAVLLLVATAVGLLFSLPLPLFFRLSFANRDAVLGVFAGAVLGFAGLVLYIRGMRSLEVSRSAGLYLLEPLYI